MSMKILAHQFFIAERCHSAIRQRSELRQLHGSAFFESFFQRGKNEFAHGVFAQVQNLELLLSSAKESLASGDSRPVGKHLDAIRGVSSEIVRIVRDALSLATMLSERNVNLESRPTELNEWVDVEVSCKDAEKSLEPLARMSGKTIVTRVESPATLPLLKKAFDEILSNLLHNAIKYSRIGTKIKITLHHSGRFSLLDVTSYGIPIRKEDQRRIFELGFRTVEAAQISFNALGIGLHQAENLAKQAGAELYLLASEPVESSASNVLLGRHTPSALDTSLHRNTFRLRTIR